MRKIKIVLLTLIVFFILTPLISTNLNNSLRNVGEKTQKNKNNNIKLNHGKNLRISKTWENFEFTDITSANWSIAASYDWRKGSDNLTDPYIIENIPIDANGSGSGIAIENSTAYFKIQNCEIYNSGTNSLDGGISDSLEAEKEVEIIITDGISESPIHIDDTAENNWEWASTQPWCSGSGTDTDPYIIQDLIIDAGGVGNGILIENSNIYFRIENCEIYNSGTSSFDAGIKLDNTYNGIISGNTITNFYIGIHLYKSHVNTISGNTANLNTYGIYFDNSHFNTISGNTANVNDYGIYLYYSHFNTISGNTALNVNGYGITLYICNYNSISGNTVNGNSYGIILYFSRYNTISGNTANKNIYGLYLYSIDHNTVSGNSASNNTVGILLWYSHYNTISENTINFNGWGISLTGSHDNSVSRNKANYNFDGIYLRLSHYNTISGNIENNNDYGISLKSSDHNTISGNTANNNIYGIYLYYSNNNIFSANLLVGNVFFIEEDNCIGNIIKEDNRCYTTILPSGINGLEIEPYGVDDIDVNLTIALHHETELIFSAFKDNNIEEAPLDNGIIYMNIKLNDTNNLNQNFDAPIKFVLEFDSSKYMAIEAFWFNDSDNGKQGTWEEIAFADLGNGIIVISVNHTSIFALIGKLNSFPLSSSNSNSGNVVDDITIFLFIILAVLICSLTVITASSTYYYKTRIQTRDKLAKKEAHRKKPLVKSFDKKGVKSPNLKVYGENKNLLRIFKGKNALEKPALFHGLKFNIVSNEFWEKLDKLELDDEDLTDFINDLLSFTPKERHKIIDRLLELK